MSIPASLAGLGEAAPACPGRSFRILDCTLRDGGYYTDWDFSPSLIDCYVRGMNRLPVDYVELGYRNNPSARYMGRLGYTPVSLLRRVRERSAKKLCVMLNEKDARPSDLPRLLGPVRGLVDMVRIAVDPLNFDRAAVLAGAVKEMGFEVGFNVMYMSRWKELGGLSDKLAGVAGTADLLCMVDSFGGVTPAEVRETFRSVRAVATCPIGFHGHDNLQLGLANTLAAVSCGADFVDATVLGMGRGAGNLKLELLLTYLSMSGLEVDFNALGDVVSAFRPLLEEHGWGTSLPYMLSGANSIPQREVMEWVSNRAYSFNGIVRALDNRRNHRKDNARYPLFEGHAAGEALIVGGGESVVRHADAILEYLSVRPAAAVIFSTARHASVLVPAANPKYYVLVGSEARRMAANLPREDYDGACLLPPYPRKMGTEVPGYAERSTYELKGVSFMDSFRDSCTAVALQAALDMGAETVSMVGYDGYRGGVLSEKEAALTGENRAIFTRFLAATGCRLRSLTPSLYPMLEVRSVYQYL